MLLLVHLDDINFTHRFPYNEIASLQSTLDNPLDILCTYIKNKDEEIASLKGKLEHSISVDSTDDDEEDVENTNPAVVEKKNVNVVLKDNLAIRHKNQQQQGEEDVEGYFEDNFQGEDCTQGGEQDNNFFFRRR